MKTLILYFSAFVLSVFLLSISLRILAKNSNGINIRLNKTVLQTTKIRQFILLLISTAPVIVILTIRNNVGTDFASYKLLYHDYVSWNIANIEIGVRALFKIADKIGGSYQTYLLFVAIISVTGGTMVLFRYTNQYLPFAFWVYILLYFGPICNIMAQSIAVPFIMGAFWCIYDKRKLGFIANCLCAALFHVSALSIIPLYWVYHYYDRRRTKIFIFLIILAGGMIAVFPGFLKTILSHIPFFSQYAGYIDMVQVHTFKYMLIYRLPIYVVEALFYKQLRKNSSIAKISYFFLIVEATSIIVGISTAWIGRMCYYFAFAHVLIAVDIVKYQKNYINRFIAKAALALYFFVAFGLMHFYSGFDGIREWSYL